MKTTQFRIHTHLGNSPAVAATADDFVHGLQVGFCFPTDSIQIHFGETYITVPICYGLSDWVEDTLALVAAMHTHAGQFAISPHNSELDGIDADWVFKWSGDQLLVDFEWRTNWPQSTGIAELPSSLVLSKAAFVRQWLNLYRKLLDHIRTLTIEDQNSVLDVRGVVNTADRYLATH